MPVAATPNEEAQLSQTIEMFEVITQSQPLDYQSLEILKEAYFKMGRQKEAVRTSKRIASAYLSLGQLSSAILEYEGILQRFPGDPDVEKALAEIESKATNLSTPKTAAEPEAKVPPRVPGPAKRPDRPVLPAQVDDGRQPMHKLFVEGKLISEQDFNLCWPKIDPQEAPKTALEPFIQTLADRQMVALDVSIKLLLDKARVGFLPIDRYELDIELARSFPREICQRWCVLPFDRMSKTVLAVTANPFNRQATLELETFAKSRLLWYVAFPADLRKVLAKVFR